MKRIDWRLIRPPTGDGGEGARTSRALVQLWKRASSFVGDHEAEGQLVELEKRYVETTLSPCEAAGAPRVEDDPDWESRMIDEFEASTVEDDLEAFLAERRVEHDCERCPYASMYSIFPMDLCIFSAGALEEILVDPRLVEAASRGMKPQEMNAYAQAIKQVLVEKEFREHLAVHAEDYLEKAASFLQFWSQLGFSIEPAILDEQLEEIADAHDEDEDEETPTLH